MALNNYKIYSIDEILQVGKPVVLDKFKDRIEEIEECNLLYENDRSKIYEHYLNEMYKYGIFKKTNYNPLMITPNYLSKSTNALLRYAMSENPVYSLNDKNEEKTKILVDYVRDFGFNDKIKQIITRIDVTGNCFTRVIPSRKNKKSYDLQILDTNQVYIVQDMMTDEVIAYVIYTLYQDENDNYFGKYLVSEVGKNTYYNVKINNGIITDIQFEREEKLPFDDFAVQNFVVNHEYNNFNYGVPQYRDVIPIQSNLIMLLNTVQSIIYRYSAPTAYGPPIVTEGEVEAVNTNLPNIPVPNVHLNTGLATAPKNTDKKEDVVSLAGKYLNMTGDGDVKPGYLTWDGKLNQQLDFISFLKNDTGNFLAMPEVTKDDSEWTANIVSGKALKLKSMQSIEKTSLYLSSIKYKLEKLLQLLTGIDETEIVIIFQDGIVDFPDEEVMYVTERINNGTMSIADGIAYLDGTTLEDAEEKALEIVRIMNKIHLEENSERHLDSNSILNFKNENNTDSNITPQDT